MLCLSNHCSARDELHVAQHVSEHWVPAIIGVTEVSFQSCSRGLNIYGEMNRWLSTGCHKVHLVVTRLFCLVTWLSFLYGKACCNSCKILSVTLKFQKRLNSAQIHLIKTYCCGQACKYVVVAVSQWAVLGVLFLHQVLLAVCSFWPYNPKWLNCTKLYVAPECKIFTREVTYCPRAREFVVGKLQENMVVLKLIGL